MLGFEDTSSPSFFIRIWVGTERGQVSCCFAHLLGIVGPPHTVTDKNYLFPEGMDATGYDDPSQHKLR